MGFDNRALCVMCWLRTNVALTCLDLLALITKRTPPSLPCVHTLFVTMSSGARLRVACVCGSDGPDSLAVIELPHGYGHVHWALTALRQCFVYCSTPYVPPIGSSAFCLRCGCVAGWLLFFCVNQCQSVHRSMYIAVIACAAGSCSLWTARVLLRPLRSLVTPGSRLYSSRKRLVRNFAYLSLPIVYLESLNGSGTKH
jgi:hypothetical protein